MLEAVLNSSNVVNPIIKDRTGSFSSNEFDNPKNREIHDGKEVIAIRTAEGNEFHLDPNSKRLAEVERYAKEADSVFKQKQKENGWTDEYTEKRIVEAITYKIHLEYGGYDPLISKELAKIDELKKEIDKLEKEEAERPFWQFWGSKEEEIAQKKEELSKLRAENRDYYYNRDGKDEGIRKVDDMPNGTLVCAEYAMIASYAMHKAGIPNHCMTGTVDSPGSRSSGYHSYVVSDKTRNIVEATAGGKGSYNKNINHADVANGEKAVTINEHGNKSVYGTNKGREGVNDKDMDANAEDSKKLIADTSHLPAKIDENDPKAVAQLEREKAEQAQKDKEAKELKDYNDDMDERYRDSASENYQTFNSVNLESLKGLRVSEKDFDYQALLLPNFLGQSKLEIS